MDLKIALRQIVEQFSKDTVSQMCRVKSVDLSKGTCEVIALEDEVSNDHMVIRDVMFQAGGSSSSGVTLVPKVDSIVMVSFLKDSTAFISLTSKVEKIDIKNDEEDLKGLLTDLISAIEQLTVPTGVGPSGVPINATAFSQIKQRLSKLFN